MTFWQTTEMCSNPGFLVEPRKNFLPELQGNLIQKQYLLGPMTWKVTQRNVWKDVANLRIERLNNYKKSQHHAWMTINWKKKKWVKRRIVNSLLNNCSEMLGWYLVVCGRACSRCHKVDKNLVTNAWRVWSHTFIIQVNTGNSVTWETQHNNADLDCFKTLIVLETLTPQNQHQEGSCVFSEVTRLCQ